MESRTRHYTGLAVIAALLAITATAVVGCKKEEPMTSSSTTQQTQNQPDTMGQMSMPAHDVVAIEGIEQKTCPVMEGNPIDPNIYVEYQGKKVYFCCASCKATFLANPEKYLAKLPQFQE